MRKIILVQLISLICLAGYSQNCNAPVSSIAFQQKVSQLSSLKNDQQRLARASEFVETNCLLTYQVKQIAELFGDDITRLSFVENAYRTTFDKENFYDVYDVFAYFSSVMRLHDFISANNQRDNRPPVNPSGYNEPVYSFPKYNYPSYKIYKETTLCKEPVSDELFLKLISNLLSQPDDEVKVALAVQLAENNCLTVEQIMKVGSLISKEQKRLDYLKRTYNYTYDIGNYEYNDQLFSDATYHDEFKSFVHQQRGRGHDQRRDEHSGEPICRVSDQEFADITVSIKNQTFNNTQLNLAKQIVKTKQCFTTLQIKQLIDIFTFEDSKLEMAKYCYPYCTDRNNYYKINDCFTFSSSVDALTNFISSQQ